MLTKSESDDGLIIEGLQLDRTYVSYSRNPRNCAVEEARGRRAGAADLGVQHSHGR